MKKKILIDLIILIIFVSIFSIAIVYAAEATAPASSGSTTGTTGGTGTTGTTSSGTGEVTTIIADARTQDLGKEALKNGNPKDVQVTAGKFEFKEHEGGKFTAMDKSLDGKTDLSDKTDFKSKDNEIIKPKGESTAKINDKGQITDLDVTGAKPAKPGEETKVDISGKKFNTEVKLGEGDRMTKKSEQIPTSSTDSKQGKSNVFETELKKGNILDVKRTKREKEDEEGNDQYYRFLGKNILMTDDIAKQLGMPSGSRYSGALGLDPRGNWFSDKGVEFFDAEGKLIGRTPMSKTGEGLASKYNNVNPEIHFFNKENWNGEQGKLARENGLGSYAVFDPANKEMFVGSKNNKIGVFELGDGNPYDGFRTTMIPDKNSEISIQGTATRPEVKFKGDGAVYFGEGAGFKAQGNELSSVKNAKIAGLFGEAGTNEFGLKYDFSRNYNTDIYSKNNKIISGLSDSGAITNIAISLDNKGVPITQAGDSRVIQNEPPRDSKGSSPSLIDRIKGLKDILPGLINTPVQPTQPVTPACTPGTPGCGSGCTPGTPGCSTTPIVPPITPPVQPPEPPKTPNTAYQTTPYKYQLYNPGQANDGTTYDFNPITQTYARDYNPQTHSKGAFIKVGAEWCPGCVATNGAFDSLKQQYSGTAYFSHFDITNSNNPQIQRILQQSGLAGRSIPFIIHLDNGNVQLLTPQGNSATSVIDQLRQRLR